MRACGGGLRVCELRWRARARTIDAYTTASAVGKERIVKKLEAVLEAMSASMPRDS